MNVGSLKLNYYQFKNEIRIGFDVPMYSMDSEIGSITDNTCQFFRRFEDFDRSLSTNLESAIEDDKQYPLLYHFCSKDIFSDLKYVKTAYNNLKQVMYYPNMMDLFCVHLSVKTDHFKSTRLARDKSNYLDFTQWSSLDFRKKHLDPYIKKLLEQDKGGHSIYTEKNSRDNLIFWINTTKGIKDFNDLSDLESFKLLIDRYEEFIFDLTDEKISFIDSFKSYAKKKEIKLDVTCENDILKFAHDCFLNTLCYISITDFIYFMDNIINIEFSIYDTNIDPFNRLQLQVENGVAAKALFSVNGNAMQYKVERLSILVQLYITSIYLYFIRNGIIEKDQVIAEFIHGSTYDKSKFLKEVFNLKNINKSSTCIEIKNNIFKLFSSKYMLNQSVKKQIDLLFFSIVNTYKDCPFFDEFIYTCQSGIKRYKALDNSDVPSFNIDLYKFSEGYKKLNEIPLEFSMSNIDSFLSSINRSNFNKYLSSFNDLNDQFLYLLINRILNSTQFTNLEMHYQFILFLKIVKILPRLEPQHVSSDKIDIIKHLIETFNFYGVNSLELIKSIDSNNFLLFIFNDHDSYIDKKELYYYLYHFVISEYGECNDLKSDGLYMSEDWLSLYIQTIIKKGLINWDKDGAFFIDLNHLKIIFSLNQLEDKFKLKALKKYISKHSISNPTFEILKLYPSFIKPLFDDKFIDLNILFDLGQTDVIFNYFQTINSHQEQIKLLKKCANTNNISLFEQLLNFIDIQYSKFSDEILTYIISNFTIINLRSSAAYNDFVKNLIFKDLINKFSDEQLYSKKFKRHFYTLFEDCLSNHSPINKKILHKIIYSRRLVSMLEFKHLIELLKIDNYNYHFTIYQNFKNIAHKNDNQLLKEVIKSSSELVYHLENNNLIVSTLSSNPQAILNANRLIFSGKLEFNKNFDIYSLYAGITIAENNKVFLGNLNAIMSVSSEQNIRSLVLNLSDEFPLVLNKLIAYSFEHNMSLLEKIVNIIPSQYHSVNKNKYMYSLGVSIDPIDYKLFIKIKNFLNIKLLSNVWGYDDFMNLLICHMLLPVCKIIEKYNFFTYLISKMSPVLDIFNYMYCLLINFIHNTYISCKRFVSYYFNLNFFSKESSYRSKSSFNFTTDNKPCNININKAQSEPENSWLPKIISLIIT